MNFFQRNKEPLTRMVTSIVSIVLSLLASFLYDWLKETFIKANEMSSSTISFVSFVLIGIIIVFLGIIIFFVSKISVFISNIIFPDSTYNQYLQYAFINQKQMFSSRQELFQNKSYVSYNDETFAKEANSNMQLAVNCCYSFFEKSFTKNDSLVDDIKFEVTFMTKSYIDGGITIPYSCNKEHRTPISMLERSGNPDLYNGTETAKIYSTYNSNKKPKMLMISNSENNEDYEEVYEGQKQRIKSSIILPVLSHRNELLGTLVVHCDKKNFFKKRKYAFWQELMEIFSVDIGYFKLVLDNCIKNNDKIVKPF